jgi:tRNA threonylcarbamoyladenosine biosynthesis protein TsaB
LLQMLDDVLLEAQLQRAQIDTVAVSHGPGSFTGLRIGVGVAQGLAYATGCSMIGVSSLQALAHQAGKHTTPVVTGLDARMGEVYWGEFDCSEKGLRQMHPLSVASPEQFELELRKLELGSEYVMVGNAWTEYRDRLTPDLVQRCSFPDVQYPIASAILAVAESGMEARQSPLQFAPIYVRDNVAKKSAIQ